MIDTPEIAPTTEQRAAVIHLTVPRSQISEVMGPAIGEVMATVQAQGIAMTGPVFSYHFRMDPDTFDFEVGVPVATPVAPSGRVISSVLPARRVARTVYHGGYEGLGDAWSQLNDWIASEGHGTAPDLWERYLVGPESGPDPAAWTTELNRPLE